jgi:uncharacterized membrane protein YdjX (TVP38/TMEM64 family)
MLRKIGVTLFYIAIAVVIYAFKDPILQWFQASPPIMLVLPMATLMSLFPVIPYPIVGGVMGAVYGSLVGGLLTWTGSTAASFIMFLFVRFGYQDWGQRVLKKYEKIHAMADIFDRNAFLMILFSRMIPFIPSMIINVYAAISRVSFLKYAVASALGKVPAMLLFAVIGSSLMTGLQQTLFALAVYGLFLTITIILYRLWLRSSETG